MSVHEVFTFSCEFNAKSILRLIIILFTVLLIRIVMLYYHYYRQ